MGWLRRFRAARAERSAPVAEPMEPRLLFSADIAAGLGLAANAASVSEVRTLTDGGEFASATQAADNAAIQAAYAASGLAFEVNEGQAGEGVDFVARGSGYGIALDGGNAVLTLGTAAGEQAVSLTLAGANADASAQGEGLLDARSNYIVGGDATQWHTGIANYGAVTYQGVYDGVDVRYYGTQRQLEYDFIVAAGADAGAIRLQFDGVESASVADNGDLVLRVAGSGAEVRFQAPVSYQRGEGGLETVASSYRVNADGTIGFALGAYDRTRELVIDPVLNYATYFGDAGTDTALGVATDAAGNIYITGRTTSNAGVLATVAGPGGGAGDIFVAKFSSDLSRLIYATRIGGTGDEQGNAIAVDANGNVAVAGWTQSGDFPTLAAADASISGGQDAVVFKLDAAGALVFSTYFGGTAATDSGNAVGFDGAGNVYAAGEGSSAGALSVVLAAIFGTTDNAFVNKYDAGGALVYSQMIGGNGNDLATGLAVGAAGDVYVVGNTESTNMATVGAERGSLGGAIDGFLVHLDAAGTNTLYATYVGGGDADSVTGVAIDGAGKAWLVGETRVKNNANFTITSGAVMGSTTVNNADTGFLRGYDTTKSGGNSLVYSTYIGGSAANDRPTDVAYVGGRVVVAGQAASTAGFLLTPDAQQATNPGQAMFMVVINPAASGAAGLEYGTYYGSTATGGALAVSGSKAYLVGGSTTAGYAATGGFQATKAGGSDVLLTGFSVLPNTPPVLVSVTQPAPMLEDGGIGSVAVSNLGVATDAEESVLGIAVIGTSSANGTWGYSLDGGTTWTSMGSRSATNALLLPADGQARIGFLPTTNYNGTVTNGLTFVAWDRSSGTAGGSADTTLATATAFSATSGSINVVVTAVNDPPVRTGGTMADLAVAEDGPSTSLGLNGLAYGPGGGTDENGQSITIRVTAVPTTLGDVTLANGTLVTANTVYTVGDLRTMRFKSAADVNGGPETFSWTVTDNGGGTDTLAQSIAITVTPVNDAPNTVDDSVTATEDTPATYTAAQLLGNDRDPEGNAMTIVQVAGNTNGTAVINANGSVTFTPDADFSGTASFKYKASDGTDTSQFATVTVTVAAANDAPVAVDDALAATEDTPVTYTAASLVGNDTDEEGDALVIASVSSVSGGVAHLNADGTVTFTPDADATGAASFTYTVSDGQASSAAATARVTIAAVNDAPTTSAVTLGPLAEDGGPLTITTVQLLLNARDADNATLTVSSLAASTGTLVNNGNGTWSFTPALDDATSVAFTYTISDGAATVAGSAGLDLTPVNDAPASTAVALTPMAEDGGTRTITAAQLLVNASDVDGDTLSVSGVGASSGTLVDNGNATWSFTPASNDDTAVTFTYAISDGTDDIAATATLDLTPVNDAPTTSIVTLPALAEDGGPVTITAAQLLVNARDIDSGTLTVSSLSASHGTLVDNGNGTWTFTPALNDATSVGFTYTISDGTATVAGTASLDLTPVNDAPVTTTVVLAAMAEDSGTRTITTAELLVNAADVDGDTLTASGLAASSGTLVNNGNGTWSFTPALNDDGAVSFTYTISDGIVGIAASATLDLTPVNDAPTTSAVALPALAEDGSSITITSAQLLVNARDVDSATLTVGSVSASSGTLIDNGDGTWTFTPVADDDGAVSFAYTVSDGALDVAATATLDLAPVNDAPTTSIVTLPAVAEDGGAVTITEAQLLVNARDVDSATLTVSSLSASHGTLVDNGNGTWTFTPALNDSTSVGFTYTISDGTATVAGTAGLDLTPVNDAPVATAVALAAMAEDSGTRTITTAELLVNATDVDGDTLTASGLAASSGTLVNNGNGTWSFTPALNDDGAVSFSYTVSDGIVGIAASATLDLTAVNDAPTTSAVALTALAEDGGPVTITAAQLLVNARDVDSATLTAGSVSASSGTLIDNGDGTWTFTPVADDDGAVSFAYTVSDGALDVAATATLDLAPVNDAPTTSIVTLPAVAEDGGPVTITAAQLLRNARDIDSATLTVSSLSASSGTLVDNGNGTWSFTPALNDDTSVGFTYTISDGSATVTGAVSLDLTPVNDAPVTTPVTLTAMAEDSGTRTITAAQLLANASDVDGDSLTAAGLTASSGTLVNNGNGTWSFTPALNDDSAVSFSYTISDGTSAIAASATLDLTPVNDVPTTSAVALSALAEDGGPVTITEAQLLLNARDIDSATLTVSSLGASSGTLVDNGNGTWSFTPSLNDSTSVSFTYAVSDGAATVAGTATLDLTPVNDAPVATAVALAAMAEDSGTRTITAGQLLLNASDVDGDTLTVSSLAASSGTLVNNGNGTWSFTPALNDDSAVNFAYTISDGTVDIAASATLDLTPVNDAPTTSAVALPAANEDGGPVTITVAQLLVNARDIDSATFNVSNLSASSGTLVDNGNGTWSFTPALNDDTSVDFAYTISDGAAGIAGTASLDLAPVNDAPTATPVSLTDLAEDSGTRTITEAQLLLNAGDVDGDTLAVSGLAASSGTLVNNGNGTWSFTPALNDDGGVTFTYTVSDGISGAAATATLDLTPINDAPTTSTVTLPALGEDAGPVTITAAQLLLNARDIDSASLTVTGLTASSGSLVDNGNGTWSFTPGLNDDDAVTFTYTVNDGAAGVAANATLDLTPVNDAPTTSAVTLPAVAEDGGPVTITAAQLLLNARDIDSASLTVSSLGASTGTLVDNGNGTWSFTPALDDSTAVAFTYTISDGTADVAGTASLDLTPVNDAPLATTVALSPMAEDSGTRTITTAQLLLNASDVDGDTLTATGLAASSGTLVNNGNGTWSFTPSANDDSAVSFTYTVSDGIVDIAATATLDLTPVNDAPTTSAVTLPALAEDGGPITITTAQLLLNARDIDSATLSASNLGASSGTLVNNGNGTWSFTPTLNDDAAVTFTYTVSDGGFDIAAAATLDLMAVNDAPTTSAVTLPALAEDGGPITITTAQLLLNARDIDSATLSASNLGASSGTLVNNGNGTWSFTPTLNDDAAVTFTYTVSDGGFDIAAAATLDLMAVNDAPTTSAVTLPALSEDGGPITITTAQLLLNARDIDSATLSASNLGASSGTLVNNGNGTWSFTPTLNDDAAVTFTYTVSDGGFDIAAAATLDLMAVNDAPTTSAVTLPALSEDGGPITITTAQLLLNARDIDSATLTVSNLAASSGTLVDNGNGTWTFTPAANDASSVSFGYTISDGTANVSGTAGLDLTPVNDAPVATSVALAAMAEDTGPRTITSAQLLVNASDVDGDPLTVSGLATSSGTLVNNGNGTWGFTPLANDDGAVNFTYAISDGTIDIAATATLDLTLVNDAPTTSAVTLPALSEDGGPITITTAQLLLYARDIDSATLTVSNLAASRGTLVDIGNGSWTFTPAVNDDAAISFTYTISDAAIDIAATATLDLTPVNDAPTTSAVTLPAIAEDGGAVTITSAQLLLNAGDVDSASFTVGNVSASSGSLVDNGNGTWTFTPAADDATAVVLTYIVSDGAASAVGTANLDLAPVNDAPVATPVTLAAMPEDGGTRTITTSELLLNASDVDGDTLAVADLVASSGTLLDNGNGTWNFTPASNDDSAVDFTYTVTDGIVNIASTGTLDLTPVNDVPTTRAVTLSAIAEDSGPVTMTSAQLLLNAGDIDSATLTVNTLGASSGTLVDNGNGTWTFTPASDDATSVVFRYTVSDGAAGAGGTADLDLTPVNDAPTTSAVTLPALAEDAGPVRITSAQLLLDARDIDSAMLTVSQVSASSGTLVDNGDGTWAFTAAANDASAVAFTYTISDGAADVAGTASLDLAPVNDAPTATTVSLAAMAEDGGVRTITASHLLANAADIDGDALSVTGLAASSGTVVDNGNGTWSFTSASDDDGSVAFTYTISDGAIGITAAATLDLTPVNDAPTTNVTTLPAMPEDGGPVTITTAQLLLDARDVDSAALTVGSLAASRGTLVDNGNGTWTFTPATNDDTSVAFSYTITDGAASVAATATLDLLPANDAPVTSAVVMPALDEDGGPLTITAAQLLANASDLDGDTLRVASLVASSGTLVDHGDGTWTFTAAADDASDVSFRYDIQDGATSIAGAARMDLAPVEDAPLAVDDALAAVEDTSITYTASDLLANDRDADGDALAIAGVTSGAGGTVVLNADGSVTFRPDADFHGQAQFTYTVADGQAESRAATVLVAVASVNDAPQFGGDANVAVTVDEDSFAVTTVRASDADLPVQQLAFSISGGVDAGRFVIDAATGALSFAAATGLTRLPPMPMPTTSTSSRCG
jgi:hypothetical protein